MILPIKIQHSTELLNAVNLNSDLTWWALDGDDDGYVLYIEDDGNIVAQTSIRIRPISLENQVFHIAHLGHHIVHPLYRKQGMFKRILLKSEEICLNHNVDGIFVTPNAISEPIYRSQGYSFNDPDGSCLFLINLNKHDIQHEDRKLATLTKQEYFDQTSGFVRFHPLNQEAFIWRFSRPALQYHFVAFQTNDGIVHIAFREGTKGPIETNVLAEIFINGVKPPLSKIAATTKSYLPKLLNIQSSKIIVQSTDVGNSIIGVDIYRNFPFALKILNKNVSNLVKQLIYYQFTDSDFG